MAVQQSLYVCVCVVVGWGGVRVLGYSGVLGYWILGYWVDCELTKTLEAAVRGFTIEKIVVASNSIS